MCVHFLLCRVSCIVKLMLSLVLFLCMEMVMHTAMPGSMFKMETLQG